MPLREEISNRYRLQPKLNHWPPGFHLEICPRGGNWRNLDFKGGGGGGDMMVEDVTNFTNTIWGVGVCLNVCGAAGFWGFGGGENSKVWC